MVASPSSCAHHSETSMPTTRIITIPEHVWRHKAQKHRQSIHRLLEPGLTSKDDSINSGVRRGGKRRKRDVFQDELSGRECTYTALDPKNPIYNFLIEYYGLKGAKGTKRLGRWSPDPSLLLKSIDTHPEGICEIDKSSDSWRAIMTATEDLGGIFLENAKEEDMGGILHLRGCLPIVSGPALNNASDGQELLGVVYNPAVFYQRRTTKTTSQSPRVSSVNDNENQRDFMLKTIGPFTWYSSVLERTLASEPILHCFGLHEWAMQYQPPNAPSPPSAKYQSHLPLRVSRQVINSTVERRGVHCSHIDALRFFAPAAIPLNNAHGESYPLDRVDQLELEQKGCVHAHMDLLKIALKLQPFIDPELVKDVLAIALKARKLDVEASPYDATAYGAGVVAIETEAGRQMYKQRQRDLMEEAEIVRANLLCSYRDFMSLAFDEELIAASLASIHQKQLP